MPSLQNAVDQPRITVITPSYNQGQFLERTIRSVLDQGYANLEYFVIDGGSTDQSVEIIRQYADQLAGWISEPDGGQTDAINKGVARATGQIISYLNSDDVLLEGALQTVSRLLGPTAYPALSPHRMPTAPEVTPSHPREHETLEVLLLEHPFTGQREYDRRPTTVPVKLIGVGEAGVVRECARPNSRRAGVLPHSVHSDRVGTV